MQTKQTAKYTRTFIIADADTFVSRYIPFGNCILWALAVEGGMAGRRRLLLVFDYVCQTFSLIYACCLAYPF